MIGVPCRWQQSFIYKIRSCSSTAHAHLPSSLARGWCPPYYVFILKGGFQSKLQEEMCPILLIVYVFRRACGETEKRKLLNLSRWVHDD